MSVDSPTTPEQSSAAVVLAADLLHRCYDQTRKWAYHPQSSNVGRVVSEYALARLLSSNGTCAGALRRGRLAATFNLPVRGRRRRKKIDLVVGDPEESVSELADEELVSGAIRTPHLLVEVKACMTAHRKAGPRLVSELLSTLELADDLSPRPALMGFLVMNFASQFTSPKNLPGPNMHEPTDAPRALQHVLASVPFGSEDGYDALVVVPIDFDNESRALSFDATTIGQYGTDEDDAFTSVDRLLADRMKDRG